MTANEPACTCLFDARTSANDVVPASSVCRQNLQQQLIYVVSSHFYGLQLLIRTFVDQNAKQRNQIKLINEIYCRPSRASNTGVSRQQICRATKICLAQINSLHLIRCSVYSVILRTIMRNCISYMYAIHSCRYTAAKLRLCTTSYAMTLGEKQKEICIDEFPWKQQALLLPSFQKKER